MALPLKKLLSCWSHLPLVYIVTISNTHGSFSVCWAHYRLLAVGKRTGFVHGLELKGSELKSPPVGHSGWSLSLEGQFPNLENGSDKPCFKTTESLNCEAECQGSVPSFKAKMPCDFRQLFSH